MSSAHRGCFLTWHQGPGQSILWFSGWGHHGVQRRLQIYPSRRGDLPCTVALGTFSKLSEPFRTNRVTEEGILGNLSPKAGSQWPAGDDQGSTRGLAVDGASVEMASSSFSFSWQQPRCGRWGRHKTRSVIPPRSGWILGSGSCVDRPTPYQIITQDQPNPTMHVLSEKEGRPAPGSPSTGRRTAGCFGPAQQVSLSIGPGTPSRRMGLGLEKDWQPFNSRHSKRSLNMELSLITGLACQTADSSPGMAQDDEHMDPGHLLWFPNIKASQKYQLIKPKCLEHRRLGWPTQTPLALLSAASPCLHDVGDSLPATPRRRIQTSSPNLPY